MATEGDKPHEVMPPASKPVASQSRATKSRIWRGVSVSAKYALKVLGWLVALFGLVSGYVALIPHISASQSGALDPNSPFSTPFVISNDGPLAVKNVVVLCGIGSVTLQGGRVIKGAANYSSRIIETPNYSGQQNPPQMLSFKEINPGDRATVPCVFPTESPITEADIAISVTFSDWLHLQRTERKLRFVTMQAKNGNLYWYPQPLP